MAGQKLRSYSFSVMRWSIADLYKEIMERERRALYATPERVARILERYPENDEGRPGIVGGPKGIRALTAVSLAGKVVEMTASDETEETPDNEAREEVELGEAA